MISPELRRAFDVAISLTGYRHVSVLLGAAVEQAIEIPAMRNLPPQPFYLDLREFGRDVGQIRYDARRGDHLGNPTQALSRSWDWLLATRIIRPFDVDRFPGFFHLETDHRLWIVPLPEVAGSGHRTPTPLLSTEQIEFVNMASRLVLNWKTPSHVDVPPSLQDVWGDAKTPCMIDGENSQWEESEGCDLGAQKWAPETRRPEVGAGAVRSGRHGAQKWAPARSEVGARRPEVGAKREFTPLAPPPLHSPPIIPPGGELTSKFDYPTELASRYLQATSTTQSTNNIPPTPLSEIAEDSQIAKRTGMGGFENFDENKEVYQNSPDSQFSQSAEGSPDCQGEPNHLEVPEAADHSSTQRGIPGAIAAEQLLGAEKSRDASPEPKIRGEGKNSDAARKLAVWAGETCGSSWAMWAKSQADVFPTAWLRALLERHVVGVDRPKSQNWLQSILRRWKQEGRCDLLPTAVDATTGRINDSRGGLDGGAKPNPLCYIDSSGKKHLIMSNLADQEDLTDW